MYGTAMHWYTCAVIIDRLKNSMHDCWQVIFKCKVAIAYLYINYISIIPPKENYLILKGGLKRDETSIFRSNVDPISNANRLYI